MLLVYVIFVICNEILKIEHVINTREVFAVQS